MGDVSGASVGGQNVTVGRVVKGRKSSGSRGSSGGAQDWVRRHDLSSELAPFKRPAAPKVRGCLLKHSHKSFPVTHGGQNFTLIYC